MKSSKGAMDYETHSAFALGFPSFTLFPGICQYEKIGLSALLYSRGVSAIIMVSI
jgi:hypothetical protein